LPGHTVRLRTTPGVRNGLGVRFVPPAFAGLLGGLLGGRAGESCLTAPRRAVTEALTAIAGRRPWHLPR
jgi:hypothetical protein